MLINKLKEDRIKHFKLRNDDPVSRVAYSVLGVLIGDATKESKEPVDEKVISLIKKFIENAKVCIDNSKESLSQYNAATEINILESYLPKQLTEDEIKHIIIVTFIDLGSRNLGAIMKHFKTNFSGQYDGQMVSSIAKELCK